MGEIGLVVTVKRFRWRARLTEDGDGHRARARVLRELRGCFHAAGLKRKGACDPLPSLAPVPRLAEFHYKENRPRLPHV